MATIRMTHPEHGYHIAYNGAEVQALEKAGWAKITEAEFKKVVAAKSAPAEVEQEDEGEVVVPKKRGPKPKA